jgi:hypothetical protein
MLFKTDTGPNNYRENPERPPENAQFKNPVIKNNSAGKHYKSEERIVSILPGTVSKRCGKRGISKKANPD